MNGESELIKKIFRLGFYGDKIGVLSDEELEMAKKLPTVEIVSKEELEKSKQAFRVFDLKSLKGDEINSESIVKLNGYLWRNIATNFKSKITSQHYFKILNYLYERKDEFIKKTIVAKDLIMQMSQLYSFLSAVSSVKTIKVKESTVKFSLLEVNPITGVEEEVLHLDECDSSKLTTAITIWGEPIDLSKVHIYRNYPMIYAYRDYIKSKKSTGITNPELAQRFGDTTKEFLRVLQKIISFFPEDKFGILSEVIYKSTTLRIFTEEDFKVFQKRKSQIISENIDNSELEDGMNINLTTDDRKLLINIMLEKYSAFILDQPVLDEMAKRIGYKYKFDRRNFAKIAMDMNHLNVFTESSKIVIARKEIIKDDPIIINLFLTDSEEKKKNNILKVNLTDFQKKLQYFLLFWERFVDRDNGYPKSNIKSLKMFYKKLEEFGNECYLTIDKTYEFTVDDLGCFKRRNRLHFKQRMAVYLYKSVNSDLKNLFKSKILQILTSKKIRLVNGKKFKKLKKTDSVDFQITDSFVKKLEAIKDYEKILEDLLMHKAKVD